MKVTDIYQISYEIYDELLGGRALERLDTDNETKAIYTRKAIGKEKETIGQRIAKVLLDKSKAEWKEESRG